MDDIDRALVHRLQQGLPITARPFVALADQLGIAEPELRGRIGRLLADGLLTRFGPMFNADALGGAFTLAAIAAPEEDFERIAGLVNAHPEVAHNYRREHGLNMWFVLATETPQAIDDTIAVIEQETGCSVFDFPKLDEYFVGLQLAPL